MGARSAALRAHGDDFAWSLLDAAPDATLVVSGTGEIVFVNDNAGDLFATELEDLLGRVVEDLLPAALAPVHRAHRTRYRAEPTVRSMGAGIDLRARRSDGTEFPVEISLSPLRLGDEVFAVAAVRDISERVEAEEELHRVMQTLDASHDGVFIFDALTLRYSFVNEGAVRLAGYERDELLRMTPLHLNPYTTEAEYHGLIESLREETDTVVRQSTILRKDGVEVPVEETFQTAPPGRDGNTWVITLARDISARLAAEDELRQSQEALREAEQVVLIADDRERIARDLHDTVIQRLFAEGLNLQAALVGVGDPSRTASRIEATIDGLDQTIKDLRTAVFSLQGASTTATGGRRGRLLEIVTEASTGLGFEPRLQFDGPVETVSSEIGDQIEPVLREALSNVARHANASNVRVSVTVADDVTISVADDGAGVPVEVMGGRGLANMRQRARDLGGECSIRRQPSGGSLLEWKVPVRAGSKTSQHA